MVCNSLLGTSIQQRRQALFKDQGPPGRFDPQGGEVRIRERRAGC
jgi:hypothetical protein